MILIEKKEVELRDKNVTLVKSANSSTSFITVFAQAIGKLRKEKIRKIIRASGTDKHCKSYYTWSQFIGMMFSQFLNCDSVL
ncbi:hypothetical protein HR11_00720 [Porphyromonas macacae]|uniref:DUF4372 domain-containing protein n=1 Tax=Porphyromonas macacae TaxID=28115 RepID=UPI00052D094B|nr:DUF4372 domain-containing protein [Porphyromonas macacae]KGO00440.1 hypothetical protein HR11_00720 [Porphyromonas macacae]